MLSWWRWALDKDDKNVKAQMAPVKTFKITCSLVASLVASLDKRATCQDSDKLFVWNTRLQNQYDYKGLELSVQLKRKIMQQNKGSLFN